MGLFSSEYKSFSSSVAVRVLDQYDDPLPGILAGAIIKGENLIDAVLEYNTTGWFQQVEDYYIYGRDNYIRGLPEISSTVESINLPLLRNTIQTELGSGVELLSYRKDTIDAVHWVNQFLQDVRAMNQATKEVYVFPPNIDSSAVPPLTYTGFVETTDELNMPVIDISYRWYEPGIGYQPHVERRPFTEWQRQAYQVSYKLRHTSGDAYGNIRYWTYYIGTGKPDLDLTPVADANRSSSYYPIIPFYEDKTQIGDPANAGTPLYDQSKEMMEMFGFTYEDIVSKLAEGTGESIGKNKGLYAYFYLGVEVTAGLPKDYWTATADVLEKAMEDAQPSLHYLVEFFLQEEKQSKYRKPELIAWSTQTIRRSPPRVNALVISDDSFKTGIEYFYIETLIVNGSIGPIDWCKSTINTMSYTTTDMEGVPDGLVNADTLVLMKQLTETTYLQLNVVGLKQHTEIFNQRDVTTTLMQRFDEEDVLMVVPLDRNIVLRLKDEYKNPLIHSSMFFIFNAYQRVEVKWYQTFVWKFLFTAAALYLAIPSGGISANSLGALFTVAGATAAGYALLLSYARYLIATAVVKLVAKELGLDFAFIAAIVMIAYGRIGTKSMPGLPWANELTTAGSHIWNASDAYLKEQAQQLQEEATILDIETKRLQDDLERSRKLLDTDPDMDPWYFTNPTPDLIWGQAPSEYYRMSNGTMELAGQVLEGPSNYTEIMLRLPTINDTISS